MSQANDLLVRALVALRQWEDSHSCCTTEDDLLESEIIAYLEEQDVAIDVRTAQIRKAREHKKPARGLRPWLA